jgi:hypothetical protein
VAEQGGQRHDCEYRKHEEQRMGMRRHRLRHQHGRHEDQHPEQRGVLDLLKQGFHGGRRLHTGCDGGKSGPLAGPALMWLNAGPQAGKGMRHLRDPQGQSFEGG